MADPNQQYYHDQQRHVGNPPAANPPLGYLPVPNNPVYPLAGTNINYHVPTAATNSLGEHPSNWFAVIGPEFCSTNPVELIITRNMLKQTEGNFIVEDVNGNVMFKVKVGIQLLHDRRVLRDAQGKPILTLQEKIKSAHNRWNAFRGDSKNPKDLLFSAKESSLIQLKTNLDVFLASNGNQNICDFNVKGSWSERSCVIFGGNSKLIIAQMHKKLTGGSEVGGKDKFMVTVYPNVDSAFIVALIVILDAVNHEIQLTKFDIV